MDYGQLELALQFLEFPDDSIRIQVPYSQDVHTVKEYLKSEYVKVLLWYRDYERKLVTGIGIIYFEVVSENLNTHQDRGPAFLLPRKNGDTGLGPLHATEGCDELRETQAGRRHVFW